MKRVICFLLIACFMVVALASCGGEAPAEGGNEPTASESGSDEAPAGSEESSAPSESGENGTTASESNAPGSDAPGSDAPGSDAPDAPDVPDVPSVGEVETDDYGQEIFTSPNDYDNMDMQGEEITIIVRNQLSVQREWYKDVPDDEVDEVVAVRNDMVASTLNVEVNYELMGSSNYDECKSAFEDAIMADVDSNLHFYDVAANYAYAGASDMLRDYVANLADTSVFEYFDFSLPCWNQSIVESTLINGQLYYITGDLNLSTFDKTMVIFVNKDLYDEKKQANDPDDLQDVALAGKWDYEDLYAWTSLWEDYSGDGTNTHDDLHGISASISSIPLDAMPYAWDLEYLVENADESHSYNVVGNNKIAQAVDKAKDLFDGTVKQGVGNWDDAGGCSLGGYSEPITHFANNLSVFALHILYCTAEDNAMLRNMTAEYGLLPMPKYEESQENYGTTAHDAYTLMTVIDHSKSSVKTKGAAISAYLQMSSEESYTNVRGYYINEIVKQKYFGQSESIVKSQELFNIIADNVEFTFISIYAPQLNGILNNCWRAVVMGNHVYGATTAEAAFDADRALYDSCLADVDEWLGVI